MSSVDQTLPVSLERLEIVSRIRNNATKKLPVNPFNRKQFNTVCVITKSHTQKPLQLKNTQFKKQHNKSSILKEPVLKFIVNYSNVCDKDSNNGIVEAKSKSVINDIKAVPLKTTKVFGDADPNCQNFKSLLSGCAELTLAPSSSKQYSQRTFRHARYKSSESDKISLKYASKSRPAEVHSTCSQQALMTEPCDITIDELASYFETFVHIPKKMSSMAEMMYI